MKTTLYLRNAGGLNGTPNKHVLQCGTTNRIIQFSEITHVEVDGNYEHVSFVDDYGDGGVDALNQPHLVDIWLHRGHQVEATIGENIIILHL